MTRTHGRAHLPHAAEAPFPFSFWRVHTKGRVIRGPESNTERLQASNVRLVDDWNIPSHLRRRSLCSFHSCSLFTDIGLSYCVPPVIHHSLFAKAPYIPAAPYS